MPDRAPKLALGSPSPSSDDGEGAPRLDEGLAAGSLGGPARPSVTILVPMYNEESVLLLFYEELGRVIAGIPHCDFEFLFVDDGSRDASLSIVKNLAANDARVRYVALSRNFGKERALLAGFDHVRTDAAVVIDADLQDPPALIADMIALWQQGYQDVYAQRRSRGGETWLKRATASAYYRVLQSVTQVEIQADTGDFRLLDRACIDALRRFRESERNNKALFSWIGFRKTAIPYDRDPRAAGTTKFNYWRLTNLAIDGITSFTTAPLRVSAFVGFAVSIVAFVYLLVIVIRAIIFGSDAAGYPSLMAVMLFLGGVQLLSLGVIGEYVGRIFRESKGRPVYLVGETNVPVEAASVAGSVPPAAPSPAATPGPAPTFGSAAAHDPASAHNPASAPGNGTTLGPASAHASAPDPDSTPASPSTRTPDSTDSGAQ